MPVTIYPTPASSSYPIDKRFKDPKYLSLQKFDSGSAIYCKYNDSSRSDDTNANFWTYIADSSDDNAFVSTGTALSLKTLLNISSGSGIFYGFLSSKTIYFAGSPIHYLNITIDGTLYTINLTTDGSSRNALGLNFSPGLPFTSAATTPYINSNGGYYDKGFNDEGIWTLNPSTRNISSNYLIYESSLKIEYYIEAIHDSTYAPNCYVSYKAF